MKKFNYNSNLNNVLLPDKALFGFFIIFIAFVFYFLSIQVIAQTNDNAIVPEKNTYVTPEIKTQGHSFSTKNIKKSDTSAAFSVSESAASSALLNTNKIEDKINISPELNTQGHSFPMAHNQENSQIYTTKDFDALTYNYLINLGHKYKEPAFRKNIHHKNNLLKQQSNASNELHKQKFQRRILAQQYIKTLGHKFMVLGAFTESLFSQSKDNRTYGHIISKSTPDVNTSQHTEIPYKKQAGTNIQPSSPYKSDTQTTNNSTKEIVRSTPLPKALSIPPMISRNSASAIADGEELLLVIKIDNLVLDAIFAFKEGNGAYIGLDSLFAVLDFPIDVNLTENTANGWYIKEGQNFKASFPNDGLSNGSVMVAGAQFNIPPQAYKLEGDDIYVHSSEVFKWLNFNYNINFNDLAITIIPSEKLPLQKRLARHARMGKLSTSSQLKPMLPERLTPYKAFDMPFLDVQMSTTTTQSNSNSNYSILGMGDLAYMTARYYINGNDNETVANTTLRLERESLDNNLLGPLKLSKVSIGDVGTVSLPFLRNTGQEAGVQISNRPIGQTTNFNTTNFDGEIFPGWDIELYQNNILIERQIVGDDGRYEFNDLNLFFGDNTFKMIFYGPQGQQQERIENVLVNRNSTLENDFLFDVSITEQSGKLLHNNDVNTQANGVRIAAEFEQGINKTISLQTGYTSFEFVDGSSHQVIPVGLNIYALNSKFNIAYIKDLEGGDSFQFEGSTRIKSQAASFKLTTYSEDFQFDSDESILPKSTSNLKFSGPIANYYNTSLGYSLSVANTKHYDNSVFNTVNANLSLNKPQFSLTNSLNYFYYNFDDADTFQSNIEGFTGNAQLTKNFSGYRLRAGANYSIKPEADITSVSGSLLWSISKDLISEIGLNYNDVATRASASFTWDTDFANIGTNFSYDTDDNYIASLNLRFSLGVDPVNDDIKISRNRVASGGGISARVFEDINLDGIYNENEPLIEGAKISAVNVKRHAISDVSGIAFLTGLPKNRVTDIQLEIDSLEDPFWLPATEGFSFNPRPGLIEVIDIPIITSGEVDGNVYIENKGESDNGRYVPLELLNESGGVVASTESEYDGFYLLSSVMPGNYTLRVKSSYLKKKQLTQFSAHIITIKGDGTIVRGEDILLKPIVKMVHLTKANNNSLKALNLGQFDTLRTLKLSWLILRKKHEILQAMPPLVPIKHIKKDKNSRRYNLRLIIEKDELDNTICQQLNRPANFCFIEHIILDKS